MLTGSKAWDSEEPPPPGTAGVGIRTDHGDGLDLGCIERQDMPLVLEQGQALTGALQSDGAVCHRIGRVRGSNRGRSRNP